MTVLAVDAGTTAVKAACIDNVGNLYEVSRVAVERSAGIGINAEQYWQAVAQAIQQVAGSASHFDAITVTGQGDGLWALNEHGAAVSPGLEWNSTVASEIVTQWEKDGTIAKHYARSGTVLWPGTAAALWRWAQQNHPQIVANTSTVFCAKDWINYRLCGAIATDITDASIPFLDMVNSGYDQKAFSLLGCEDLANKMAPIVQAGTEIGTVSRQAAAATGLAEGTPVLMGVIDVVAMTCGVGVVEPGQAVAVLGTTAAAMAITKNTSANILDANSEPVGATLRIDPNQPQFLRVMGASSGTSTLDWFLSRFYGSVASAHESFWADVQAGKPKVVMLPYLAGERAPFLAPQATGTFVGITSSTSRADLAHSVALGITFSLRNCLQYASGSGATPDTVVLTGGGAASAAWCQLFADVMSTRVTVDDRPHVACAGVAAIATKQDPHVPAKRLCFEPQRDFSADFQEFVEVSYALKPIWEKMSRQ